MENWLHRIEPCAKKRQDVTTLPSHHQLFTPHPHPPRNANFSSTLGVERAQNLICKPELSKPSSRQVQAWHKWLSSLLRALASYLSLILLFKFLWKEQIDSHKLAFEPILTLVKKQAQASQKQARASPGLFHILYEPDNWALVFEPEPRLVPPLFNSARQIFYFPKLRNEISFLFRNLIKNLLCRDRRFSGSLCFNNSFAGAKTFGREGFFPTGNFSGASGKNGKLPWCTNSMKQVILNSYTAFIRKLTFLACSRHNKIKMEAFNWP